MKILIILIFLSIKSFADYFGLFSAITLSTTSSAEIAATVKVAEKLSKEMKKTVELNRQILKAEIVRDTLLAKKIYWIEKLKKNINRDFDVSSLETHINLVNNKVWIYNNSLLYDNFYTRDDNE